MTTNTPTGDHSRVRLGAVADILRHHRWKIILISLLGVVGATAYYFGAPPAYASQAKLMVRYVVDRSAVDQVQDITPASGGQGGETVMLSELEILNSWDLAEKVGSLPGMEELAPKSKEPFSSAEAASVILDGLKAASPKGSNIIRVEFRHGKPELTRKALENLIQEYFKMHLEIHRPKEAAKFVAEKVEKSRTKLKGAEDDLMKLKADNGILSLPAAVAALEAELAKARSDRNVIGRELAGQRARVATLERLMAEGDGTGSPSAAPVRTLPTSNASVEELNLRLRMELVTGRAQLAAAEAESEHLKEALATAQKNLSALTGIIPRIAEKERARDLAESDFKYHSACLEKAQVDQALDPSKMPNISIVQEATPAALDVSKRNKIALGIALGSPAVAIAGILLFGLICNRPARSPTSLKARDRSSPENADS